MGLKSDKKIKIKQHFWIIQYQGFNSLLILLIYGANELQRHFILCVFIKLFIK